MASTKRRYGEALTTGLVSAANGCGGRAWPGWPWRRRRHDGPRRRRHDTTTRHDTAMRLLGCLVQFAELGQTLHVALLCWRVGTLAGESQKVPGAALRYSEHYCDGRGRRRQRQRQRQQEGAPMTPGSRGTQSAGSGPMGAQGRGMHAHAPGFLGCAACRQAGWRAGGQQPGQPSEPARPYHGVVPAALMTHPSHAHLWNIQHTHTHARTYTYTYSLTPTYILAPRRPLRLPLPSPATRFAAPPPCTHRTRAANCSWSDDAISASSRHRLADPHRRSRDVSERSSRAPQLHLSTTTHRQHISARLSLSSLSRSTLLSPS